MEKKLTTILLNTDYQHYFIQKNKKPKINLD